MGRNRTDLIVERRIDLPVQAVHRTLLLGATLVPGTRIAAADIELRVDGTLRAVARCWRTTARLLSPTGRAIAAVEIELCAGAEDTSSLVIRPAGRHPERWSSGRASRYSAAARAAADELVGRIGPARVATVTLAHAS